VRTVAAGFQESDAPVDESTLPARMLDTFYCFGFADGAQPLLVRRNGEVAGGGCSSHQRRHGASAHDKLPIAHRRNGVQTALLAVRLQMAMEAGCRVAFSSTNGIGASARNLERFRVAAALDQLLNVPDGDLSSAVRLKLANWLSDDEDSHRRW